MGLYKLINPLKNYAWGSPDFIPRLLGKPFPAPEPVAEMWLGAHPQAPSQIIVEGRSVSLDEFIQREPRSALGQAAELNGGALPFLMKVLAAAQPLSIQAHPSRSLARNGFHREDSLGVPLDSPLRNYKDGNHKPELICALTPFQALCGFRPYADVVADFSAAGLDVFFSAFGPLSQHLDQRSFQRFVLQVLSLAEPLKQEVLAALDAALEAESALSDGVAGACRLLGRHYPQDSGRLAPLLLNLYHLQPGEALYIGSGILHAYLEGAGIEVMANSDNVLRGALTPKHIDLAELARILDFSPTPAAHIVPVDLAEGIRAYRCPADEFWLRCLEPSLEDVMQLDTGAMPSIMLCDRGEVELADGSASLRLEKGEAAFLTADAGSCTLSGTGRIWLASVPPDQN